ncbi:MAG: enoyl-CoA hydratase-related protein, partial [Gammaproteobacteria bacterium]|nr:enoyl-CoA hydratase-related protein [Gammaproteobacteria bacterium]
MELINLEINNQIAVVSFNRPEKHNALDMEMFYAIVRTINQLKKDKSVRVVIVKGN